MHRREFLTTAVVATTAPLLLGMTRKSADNHPVIGDGDYKFECHHYWGTLPGELEWQTTHGTAIDSQGLIYITHQGTGKKAIDVVVVFDDKGKYVRSFGKRWHTGGHGIDIRKEGSDEFIYLAHMTGNGPVVKTTLKGEVVLTLGRPENDEYKDAKKPYRPTNVAFAPNGDFFVADGYGSGFIMKYSKDGKLLKTFGGTGKEDGKFRTPHGLWVVPSGKESILMVCDRANTRLQSFSLDGEHRITGDSEGAVSFPANIDSRGNLMLISDLHTRIIITEGERVLMDLNDGTWRKKVVDSLGKGQTPIRTQPKEWPMGKFVHPHDACFDAAGNIYVAEWVQGGRVTFLKKV